MLKTWLVIFFLFFIFGCSGPQIRPERSIAITVGMTQEEVRSSLGEPTSISMTSYGTILWTYRPSWKILPDRGGTLIVEFKNNKVIKVVRMR